MTAHRLPRLIAATLSVATTLVVFTAVISIAEPQRGELMAKSQGDRHPQAAKQWAVASAAVGANVVR